MQAISTQIEGSSSHIVSLSLFPFVWNNAVNVFISSSFNPCLKVTTSTSALHRIQHHENTHFLYHI